MEIKQKHSSVDKKGLLAALILIGVVIGIFFSAQVAFSNNLLPSSELFSSLSEWITGTSTQKETGTTTESEIKEDESSGRVIHIKTVEESVPATGKFIGVDLQKMKLYLYENGVLLQTIDVISKGRPGSKWDTPSGEYEVLYKNESHFSSIGEVYMPWSMQFFGNFFIHGWPYYPDGTEVGEGYSGGCIRLRTPDAEKVFKFASIHTPIYVYDTEDPGSEKTVLKKVPLPEISAKSYLVADLHTGEVFAERNEDLEMPIASITKLVTAIVANETISFARLIPISQSAFATYGDQGGILAGERFVIGDLYYPLLLNSSNDAAHAIAEYGAGYNHFIGLMNRKAKAIGMKDTTFEDPSGLSPNNISTASDLFQLAKYVNDKKRFIFDITTKMSQYVEATDTAPARTYTSNNPMRGREDFLGGKNGFTDEARKTLLSLFNVNDGTKDRTIAVIVLGSEDHTGDTIKLNEWINASLE